MKPLKNLIITEFLFVFAISVSFLSASLEDSSSVALPKGLFEERPSSPGTNTTAYKLPEAPVFIHLVQPGETVSSLVKLYRIEKEKILKANALGVDHHILPGRKLVIPE